MARRGHPPVYAGCAEIAQLLAEGRSLAEIAEGRGVPRQQIHRRVRAMRNWLLTRTGDAAWEVRGARTNVQVGQAWIEHDGPGE